MAVESAARRARVVVAPTRKRSGYRLRIDMRTMCQYPCVVSCAAC